MARLESLDFDAFVAERKRTRAGGAEGGGHAYAYASDHATRMAFARVPAVEHAVTAAVRVFRTVGKADLLGRAVKVGPRQFPRVHALGVRCAETLGIAPPTMYLVSSPYPNAATYGTNDDSFILVHSALVEQFDDDELLSVIGHECGHIHNNHVVYLTAMHYLTTLTGVLLGLSWFVRPALLALSSWSRRAEITSDRASVLCSRSLDVSSRSLAKLALGSNRLFQELNLDAFLEQVEESKGSVGRFTEMTAQHPWLPKRVLALRAFAEGDLYRQHLGLAPNGVSMAEVDEKVHAIIKVVG